MNSIRKMQKDGFPETVYVSPYCKDCEDGLMYEDVVFCEDPVHWEPCMECGMAYIEYKFVKVHQHQPWLEDETET